METALGTADPCPHFLSNQRTMAEKQVQPARFPVSPEGHRQARCPRGLSK